MLFLNKGIFLFAEITPAGHDVRKNRVLGFNRTDSFIAEPFAALFKKPDRDDIEFKTIISIGCRIFETYSKSLWKSFGKDMVYDI